MSWRNLVVILLTLVEISTDPSGLERKRDKGYTSKGKEGWLYM